MCFLARAKIPPEFVAAHEAGLGADEHFSEYLEFGHRCRLQQNLRLYFGLLVAQVATTLEMDDPIRSSGGLNPDVIAKIGGTNWGFAAR